MAAQLISYDLKKPGQDYGKLFDAIKAIGSWWHCLESVWIVVTDKSSSVVRDELQTHVDSNDKLVVLKLSGGWASLNLPDNCNEWLKNSL